MAVLTGAPYRIQARAHERRRSGLGASAREAFWIALEALRAHKLRSFLTLLGVVIATTTLIVVISVIHGMNLYVADHVANLGANVFIIDQGGAHHYEDGSDIIWQFLLEAMTLTGSGGLLGVPLGFGISFLIRALDILPSAVPLRSVVTGPGGSGLDRSVLRPVARAQSLAARSHRRPAL